MRVLIAPDSFKGSLDALSVARSLAAGWEKGNSGAPDNLTLLPQADGGEGTCEVIAASVQESRWVTTPSEVTGPDGRPVEGRWLRMPGDEAVVELALVSGLPLMERLDPRHAQTRGLGEVLRDAVDHGCRSISVGLGGSASTDGGAGVLRELGVKFSDQEGHEIADGGQALVTLAGADFSAALAPPPDGVRILCDVRSPLTGPRGSAAVFGPQKGADPEDVRFLDSALRHFAEVIGGDPDLPGMGAAGGTAFGLSRLWDAEIMSGALEVARLTGLTSLLGRADLVITGEGAFDSSSLAGKVVDTILGLARRAQVPVAVVAGQITQEGRRHLRGAGVEAVSLSDLAGSPETSLADPRRYLERAGEALAGRLGTGKCGCA